MWISPKVVLSATGSQTNARQLVDIGHELAGICTGHKGFGGLRQLLDEGFAHFRADFKGLWANRRAQPHQYVGRRSIQAVGGRFQHTRRQATPTGMGGSNTSSGLIAKQGRQAIGGHRRAGDAGRTGPTAVGLGNPSRIGLDHDHTMHLAQPGGLDSKCGGETTAILKHSFGAVLDMIA